MNYFTYNAFWEIKIRRQFKTLPMFQLFNIELHGSFVASKVFTILLNIFAGDHLSTYIFDFRFHLASLKNNIYFRDQRFA